MTWYMRQEAEEALDRHYMAKQAFDNLDHDGEIGLEASVRELEDRGHRAWHRTREGRLLRRAAILGTKVSGGEQKRMVVPASIQH